MRRQACVFHGPLIRYVKLRVEHASGMPGTFSPPLRVSDPDIHHGTYITHVPWCMPGSLTCGIFDVGGGENVPGIPGTLATRNFMYLIRGPWQTIYVDVGFLCFVVVLCSQWTHVTYFAIFFRVASLTLGSCKTVPMQNYDPEVFQQIILQPFY